MGLLKTIRDFMEYRKARRMGEIFAANRSWLGSYGKPQPSNYHTYLNAYADENWVYACIYVVANAIAALPWKLYKNELKRGQMIRVDAYNKEVWDLFHKPNKNDENSTWYNMIEFTQASLELVGNGYWLQDEIQAGKPQSLQYLLSSRITINPPKDPKSDKFIDSYFYHLPNIPKPIEYEPEEISHFKYMSPLDYYYGQGSLGPGRWSVDTIKEALKTNMNIFRNGARLDGIFETDKALNNIQFDRLKNQLNDDTKGTGNAHKTKLLESGVKYKSIVGTMKDLEFIQGMKLSREDVCAIFGVPPLIVGILDKATYSNYKESVKILWTFTILPKLRRLEPVISDIVHKFDRNLFFAFDTSKVEALQADQKEKSEIAKNYFSLGVPPQKIFTLLDIPITEYPGWDTGYLPLALIPVGSSPPEKPDEGKTIKMSVEEKKVALWKQFDMVAQRIEKSYHKIIDKFFSKQEKDVLEKLGKSIKQADEAEDILFDEKKEIKKWAIQNKKIAAVALIETARRELVNIGVPMQFDENDPRVVKWLDKFALEKSKEVVGNLRVELKEAIIEGVRAGEGIPDISRRIRNVYEPYKDAKWKAKRIAQTEVISASNKGANEAYKQSGVVKKKAWLATKDGRVRDSHLEAERRYAKGIPLDKDFQVGAGSGPAPGQTGVAEEDINCRCTLIPVIEEEE